MIPSWARIAKAVARRHLRFSSVPRGPLRFRRFVGIVTRSAGVGETPAPSITSFFASPTVVAPGGTLTLAWATEDATTVTLDGVSVAMSGALHITIVVSKTFVLRATSAAGAVTKQVAVTVSQASLTPDVPTSALVEVTMSAVNLSWISVPGATKYTVYRSSVQGQTGDSLGDVTVAAFTDNIALEPGQSYWYGVTASNASGESALSTQVRANGAPLVWSLPATLNFVQDTASDIDVSAFATDPENDPLTFTVEAGTLPAGITLSGDGVLSYDGRDMGATSGSPADTTGIRFGADDGAVVADITREPPAASLTNHEGTWSILESGTFALDGTQAAASPVDEAASVGDAILFHRSSDGLWLVRNYATIQNVAPAALPANVGRVYLPGTFGATSQVDPAPQFLASNALSFIGPSNTPNLRELEFTDAATCIAFLGYTPTSANGTNFPLANPWNAQFLSDTTYGFAYMRGTNNPAKINGPLDEGCGLLDWRIAPTTAAPSDPSNDLLTLHVRFLVKLEDDLEAAWNEGGMKMTGIEHYRRSGSEPGEQVSILSWHNIPIDNSYALTTYMQMDGGIDSNNDSPVFEGGDDSLNRLHPNRWYCIELGVNLNTIGQADGRYRMWLNGHLVIDKQNIVMRQNALTKLRSVRAHFFHGGRYAFKGLAHENIAKLAMSTSYIGVPAVMVP